MALQRIVFIAMSCMLPTAALSGIEHTPRLNTLITTICNHKEFLGGMACGASLLLLYNYVSTPLKPTLLEKEKRAACSTDHEAHRNFTNDLLHAAALHISCITVFSSEKLDNQTRRLKTVGHFQRLNDLYLEGKTNITLMTNIATGTSWEAASSAENNEEYVVLNPALRVNFGHITSVILKSKTDMTRHQSPLQSHCTGTPLIISSKILQPIEGNTYRSYTTPPKPPIKNR